MFLARLFGVKAPQTARRPAPAPPGTGPLRAELELCLARHGGALSNARRVDGLVSRHRDATPAALTAFASDLAQLNDGAADRAAAHYSKMEESEFFGRRSSRIALFDAFETPRRRMLAFIRDANGGTDLLQRVRAVAGTELASDIDDILAAR